MPAIPEDVMARLHRANEGFHHARLRLADVDSMDTGQKRAVAAALRAAEKELEEVTREIHRYLSPDEKGDPDAAPPAAPPGN
jgi:hypothetical protein